MGLEVLDGSPADASGQRKSSWFGHLRESTGVLLDAVTLNRSSDGGGVIPVGRGGGDRKSPHNSQGKKAPDRKGDNYCSCRSYGQCSGLSVGAVEGRRVNRRGYLIC